MSEMVLIVVEARKFPSEFPEDCVYETSYGDQYFTGDIVAEVVPGYTTENIFYSAELVDERSHPYENRHKRKPIGTIRQQEIEQEGAKRYSDTLGQPPTPEQREQISATLATKLARQIELEIPND